MPALVNLMVMARFLSHEWFTALEAAGASATGGDAAGTVVLERLVTATPDGDIRYQLVATEEAVRIRAGSAAPADVRFTSDYQTAAAIAQGRLSAQAALLDGRVRVAGNLSGLADTLRRLSGLDIVPASVRAATTY